MMTKDQVRDLQIPAVNHTKLRHEDGMDWGNWKYDPEFGFSDGHDYGMAVSSEDVAPYEGWEPLRPMAAIAVEDVLALTERILAVHNAVCVGLLFKRQEDRHRKAPEILGLLQGINTDLRKALQDVPASAPTTEKEKDKCPMPRRKTIDPTSPTTPTPEDKMLVALDALGDLTPWQCLKALTSMVKIGRTTMDQLSVGTIIYEAYPQDTLRTICAMSKVPMVGEEVQVHLAYEGDPTIYTFGGDFEITYLEYVGTKTPEVPEP